MHDAVNYPEHYNYGSMEVIDVIDNTLDSNAFFGYCIGNAAKYLARRNHKKNRIQDVEKAQWYLIRALDHSGVDICAIPQPDLHLYNVVVESMTDFGLYELLCTLAYEYLLEGNIEKSYALVTVAVTMGDRASRSVHSINVSPYCEIFPKE